MKYGHLVTIALQGEFGKPRPALVVQSDLFAEHSTITVLLLTSNLVVEFHCIYSGLCRIFCKNTLKTQQLCDFYLFSLKTV